MSAGAIPDGLRAYMPTSLFQADGTTLKPGIDADRAVEVAKGIQAKVEAMPPAEGALFLSMVKGADLAPNGQIPADIDAALDTFAATATTLLAMSGSGNALDFLARAMVEQAAEQRKNALNDRLAARETAKSQLLDQATKLTSAAEELKTSARDAMIASVVMSSIAIAGAAASGVGSFGSAARANPAVAGSNAMGSAGKWGAVGTAAGSMAQSTNQMGGAVSGYYSGEGQAASKTLEAEGSKDAAKAQETQAIGDVRKEQQQALDQMVQAIIQFLKDLKEAKAQQMQALTRV